MAPFGWDWNTQTHKQTSDHHEFYAVILVDTNGSEVRIIKQSLWLVKKPKNNCIHRISWRDLKSICVLSWELHLWFRKTFQKAEYNGVCPFVTFIHEETWMLLTSFLSWDFTIVCVFAYLRLFALSSTYRPPFTLFESQSSISWHEMGKWDILDNFQRCCGVQANKRQLGEQQRETNSIFILGCCTEPLLLATKLWQFDLHFGSFHFERILEKLT